MVRTGHNVLLHLIMQRIYKLEHILVVKTIFDGLETKCYSSNRMRLYAISSSGKH
jgi:hypothetical protein